MTIFKVYWTDANGVVNSKELAQLSDALGLSVDLRKVESNRFITMVSEITDCVSLLGVSAVVDGVLPDGSAYTWKKRRI